MRNILFFLTIIIFVSCGDDIDSSTTYHKTIQHKDTTTKYSLSEPYNIDFNVCGSSYAILYKYQKAIDSALMHSGVFFIGADSVLYIQVRSINSITEKEFSKSQGNDIMGTVTNLTIYDGQYFNIINPPLYSTFFSAFYYDSYNLYYWGFGQDADSTFACRYNIITKGLSKVFLTDNNWGTDYIGTFDPPIKKDDYIEFRTETESWVIDKDFKELIKGSKASMQPI